VVFTLNTTVPTITQTRLDAYLAAEAKILAGQSVRHGDRQLTMADLSEVRKEIATLQAAVRREEAAAAGRGGRFSQADFGGVT
jgi:flagella basal body P-ring formation protein FlgA